jgi:hypothetical protein
MAQRNYGLLEGNTNITLHTTTYYSGVYIIETTINGATIQNRIIVE